MITAFRLFQYSHLFLRERYRNGDLTRDQFSERLTSLGYLPSEITAEIRDVLEEGKEKTDNIFYL